MRMTLALTQGKAETGTLDYNGATLKFTYNQRVLSYKESKEVQVKIALAREHPEDPAAEWIIPVLTKVLLSWDLAADEKSKETLPINQEVLEQLPIDFLTDILNTIWKTASPPETPVNGSGSFS